MSASPAARPMSESFAHVVVAGQHDAAAPGASPNGGAARKLDAAAPPFNPGAGVTEARPSQRPVSEIIPAPSHAASSGAPEADAIDRYVDDLAQYEETIEAMARASLDQNFKDELAAIEQWFQVLSDAERTATLYSLLQHTSRVQQGFFIAFLQQLTRKDNRGPGGDRAAREAKKAAEVGRARRMSQNKPQLAGIAQTNEKYARLVGEESANTGSAAKTGASAASSSVYANRPRSAATPGGGFPVAGASAQASQIMAAAALAGMRPRSVVDPTAFEDASGYGMRMPPGLDGPPRGAKWSPLTPTFSNFSEIARAIERPQSTNDLDRSGAFGAQAALAARGPSKLGASSISAAAVRSPMGPTGGEAGFGARSATPARGSKLAQAQTPMSASMRGLASPAFPPGLFPSNPWAAAAAVAAASPGFAATTSLHSAGLGRSMNGSAMANPLAGPTTPGGSLKQKFASLIVENRIDTAKEVTARLNGTVPPHTPTSAAALNAAASGADKTPKPVDPIDFRLLNDIPAWLRAIRLHKYTPQFEGKRWQDIIKLDDEQLAAIGVSALGARRKLLKVFEQIRAEAPAKGISLD